MSPLHGELNGAVDAERYVLVVAVDDFRRDLIGHFLLPLRRDGYMPIAEVDHLLVALSTEETHAFPALYFRP